MTHWFFSPHPDDAALSCGGQIATLTRHGERVIVITVMAGDPPDDFQPTPFVEELWARWGLGRGKEVTAARREEDKAAMAVLGAEIEFWDFPDAIYRIDPGKKRPLYPDVQAIFGTIHQLEQQLFSLFGKDIPVEINDIVHSPLGVGGHIDHVLVNKHVGVQFLARVLFQQSVVLSITLCDYEEFPYSIKDRSAVRKALDTLVNKTQPETPQSILHPIDPAALNAKIAAIACYKSQISSFWDSIEAMERSVREYTEQVGGEREWQLIPSQPLEGTS